MPPDDENVNANESRRYWIDTGTGRGIEVTAEQARNLARRRFQRLSRQRSIGGMLPPNRPPVLTGPGADPRDAAIPAHVEADALQALLRLHIPGTDRLCSCGQPLGEFTGQCFVGRTAMRRLMELGRAPDPDPE